MELAGRVAVVTGASSGIGRATAARLAREGMQVVAVARRAERLEELKHEQPGIHPYIADVTDAADVDALATWVADRFGACHALVCNAGVGGGAFVGENAVADVRRTMEVNFFAVAQCMASFEDLLSRSAPARVVNMASVAGKMGVGPAGYAASKFAVVGFSEAVRLSWRPKGVAVTQLNPGMIRTEGMPQQQMMRTPLAPLIGKPDMVADAVVRVLRSGVREFTVPRWYRPLVMLRHVAAPLFWRVAALMPRAGGHRD